MTSFIEEVCLVYIQSTRLYIKSLSMASGFNTVAARSVAATLSLYSQGRYTVTHQCVICASHIHTDNCNKKK